MKGNPHWSVIELAVFRTGVLVIVAETIEDVLLAFKDACKKYATTKEDIEKDTREYRRLLEEDCFEDIPGFTVKLGNATQDVIMAFRGSSVAKLSEELIVHEAHHASHFICSARGISDEECETYVQEYLFHEMLCKIDDWNRKHPKKKKR